MSDVSFQDENYNIRNNQNITMGKKSGMVSWLLDKGYAKTEKTANLILLSASLIFFALTFYVIFTF